MDTSRILAIPGSPRLPSGPLPDNIFMSKQSYVCPDNSGVSSKNSVPTPVQGSTMQGACGVPVQYQYVVGASFPQQQPPQPQPQQKPTSSSAAESASSLGISRPAAQNPATASKAFHRTQARQRRNTDVLYNTRPIGREAYSLRRFSIGSEFTSNRRDSIDIHSAISRDSSPTAIPLAANNKAMPTHRRSTSGIRYRRDSIESTCSTISNATTTNSSKGLPTGDRKYTCEWAGCGQAFDRIEHLNRHKRRHTGEKPYRCLISKCPKLFSRFDNMMQHVGIHNIGGSKTEIPNIKNLSVKGNGRGRARRTNYRATQDPYDKFRRHVEGILGKELAKYCCLPTANPDYSNLTLRPLLNTEIQESQQAQSSEAAASSDYKLPPQSPLKKRPRCDSVVDGMEKVHAGSVDGVSAAAAAAPMHAVPDAAGDASLLVQNVHTQYSPVCCSASYYPPPVNAKPAAGYQVTTRPSVDEGQSSIDAHQLLSSVIRPKTGEMSNVRGQPEYRRDCHASSL